MLCFASAFCLGFTHSLSAEPSGPEDFVDVQTKSGPVRGIRQPGIGIFRGIPFAKPPIGPLRFRAPEQPYPWIRPLDATKFGKAAPQNPDPLDHIWGEVLAPGDEDCLTLNVWTPATDGKRRPVMVAIHGGAFIIGSGREVWYEGTRLAQGGDVVVVTFNYRVGALGFLDLSEVGGAEYSDSANCGLLDQVAALQWVRDNIERFGGDPDNVTVFGCSAGGISISCLMAMPAAKSLFHRAIPMSGGPSLVRSLKTSHLVTEAFLKSAGVKDLAGLQALSSSRLLKAQGLFLRKNDFGGDNVFGPVVDGRIIPKMPLDAIREGAAKDIVLLTGTTRDEARFWSLYEPILRWARPEALKRVLELIVGERWKDVIETYRNTSPQETSGNIAMAIQGDLLFWMPAIRLAEAQALHRPNDTRMYLFSWQAPVYGGRLGSPHAIDIPFCFGNLDQKGVELYTGRGDDRSSLYRTVQDALIAFARTGNPNHEGLPNWPAYESTKRSTMIFDTTPCVQNDPMEERRKLWQDVPFDGVSPAFDKSLPTTGEILRAFLPTLFKKSAKRP